MGYVGHRMGVFSNTYGVVFFERRTGSVKAVSVLRGCVTVTF